jgi:hypothetical protein
MGPRDRRSLRLEKVGLGIPLRALEAILRPGKATLRGSPSTLRVHGIRFPPGPREGSVGSGNGMVPPHRSKAQAEAIRGIASSSLFGSDNSYEGTDGSSEQRGGGPRRRGVATLSTLNAAAMLSGPGSGKATAIRAQNIGRASWRTPLYANCERSFEGAGGRGTAGEEGHATRVPTDPCRQRCIRLARPARSSLG